MASDQPVDLHHLLSLACPDPLNVVGEDPAAYLALAVHCLLVNASFVSDTRRHHTQPCYPPPPTWQGLAAHEWGVTYIRPGCCNRFQLRVASQHATAKLLVHVTEVGNKENIQLLGLYIPNYAPSKPHTRHHWPDYVTAHIVSPLVEHAMRGPPPPVPAATLADVVSGDAPLYALVQQQSPRVWAAAAVAIALGGAALLFVTRTRRL